MSSKRRSAWSNPVSARPRHGRSPTPSLRPCLARCVLLLLCAGASAGPPGANNARRPLKTIRVLEAWLDGDARPPLGQQPFAGAPLSRGDAAAAAERLWADYVERATPALRDEWEKKVVRVGEHTMQFTYRTCGKKPKAGWDLHLALHGGGGAPARVNDAQWRNHFRLYKPEHALYVTPRAPANTWNLWHVAQVDGLLARIIEGAVIVKGANPDRVYLSGYSAGGDGVYQLAPRMADRLAAAAMMAGHPNETSPLGLRNIGFTIHVGERDGAYKRNAVARAWKKKLAALHAADPAGYRHAVVIHKGLGHWVNRRDAAAFGWMAQFTRNPLPGKVVWKQDDVTCRRFYWLAVPDGENKARTLVVAARDGQTIALSRVSGIERVTVLLNDDMVDLDKAVVITLKNKTLFEGVVPRTIAALSRSLARRKDPKLFFSAAVDVDLAGGE